MFVNRTHAGEMLATALQPYANADPIVLALPRGGVAVAEPIARVLGAPLDALIVRKLGAPVNPEFAFGAVGEGGAVVIDQQTVRDLHLDDVTRDRIISDALIEIQRRVDTYRGGRELPQLANRTVIIVDDGLATGSTAAAGIAVIRALGAARIVLAVPTGSPQAVIAMRARCDEVICLEEPDWFGSVGSQYEAFPQVSDDEVIAILDRNRHVHR